MEAPVMAEKHAHDIVWYIYSDKYLQQSGKFSAIGIIAHEIWSQLSHRQSTAHEQPAKSSGMTAKHKLFRNKAYLAV